jgi:antibiotic biosynthesis monooxygenase (ABM) superfamily enzyme
MNSSDATQSGATAVITHRVRQGKEADYRFVTVFFVTAVVVLLMVYVIMPRYPALVRKWLFN